jgi:hypothetical protein
MIGFRAYALVVLTGLSPEDEGMLVGSSEPLGLVLALVMTGSTFRFIGHSLE